jgi:hypothetical protein
MSGRVLLPVLAFGALAASAAAAGGTSKEIGHAVRLKGSTKIYYAQGKAVAPKSVSAKVVPTPAQPVKVQWALACQKPNNADPAIQINASASSGQTSLRRAGTVRFKLPYPRPGNCIATVYATLSKKGSLVLRLVQT